MAVLNGQKQLLLNQVKNQPNIPLQQLVALVNQYEDLEPEDFKGYISDLLFEQLKEAGRNPEEVKLWNAIENGSQSIISKDFVSSIKGRTDYDVILKEIQDSLVEIQDLQRLTSTYSMKFAQGPMANDVAILTQQLQQKMVEAMKTKKIIEDAIRERKDWIVLEKGNYNALRNYKMKYPESVHLSELDDLMWLNTKNAIAEPSIRRYLNDWPFGKHADEANQALNEITEWDAVRRSHDLFAVDDYRDNHPNSPFKTAIDNLYWELRDEELNKMKANPSDYSKDAVDKLIAADIFTKWELIDEELITEESWDRLQLDREYFPNIQEYQIEDPHIQAPDNCTDVYLFGTPGTGKTCLLMGLTGANGSGYTINMRTNGGPYAAALQQYVNEGITPGRTFGKFVTTINGEVNEKDKHGNVIEHRINFVEMSGEEFALRIADNKEVSLSNMGTGATNLLQNNNRKVFFIIVDSTKLKVKVEYLEDVRDTDGNLIGQNIRKKYISQLDIMNKFVSLFELPQNQDIMSKVDAIHFVVTKADMLGDSTIRLTKARELLLSTYQGPIEQLKNYCRKTKRINYSTDYKPQVFAFSLGRFYLGDVFNFDRAETLQIIDTIRIVTSGTKEMSWWDKLKKSIG